MNVNLLLTSDYENKSNWTLGENKPNSNPIKLNCRKAKMNVNSLMTKDYRKKDDFAVQKNKPKTNPISEMAKMNVILNTTKVYGNYRLYGRRKNKPNSNPVLSAVEWANFKRNDGFSAYYKRDCHMSFIKY